MRNTFDGVVLLGGLRNLALRHDSFRSPQAVRYLIAAVVLVAAMFVLFYLWPSGRLETKPSAAQQSAFVSQLRAEAAQYSEASTTVDAVQVVFGRVLGESPLPVLNVLDWHGYQYAVTYRLNATGAKWVELYRPDGRSWSTGVDLDPESAAALTAYWKLTGKPAVRLLKEAGSDPELAVPATSTAWLFEQFDPAAGDNDFAGSTMRLQQKDDATFSVLP